MSVSGGVGHFLILEKLPARPVTRPPTVVVPVVEPNGQLAKAMSLPRPIEWSPVFGGDAVGYEEGISPLYVFASFAPWTLSLLLGHDIVQQSQVPGPWTKKPHEEIEAGRIGGRQVEVETRTSTRYRLFDKRRLIGLQLLFHDQMHCRLIDRRSVTKNATVDASFV